MLNHVPNARKQRDTNGTGVALATVKDTVNVKVVEPNSND